MILVAGLGNPGPRYEATRHNLGFRVVDRWVERHGGISWREKFEGHIATATIDDGERVLLLKPMTFMNLSGHCVQATLSFYKLEPSQLLVIHDELDLPFGEIRLKQGGGDAGHNGVGSVIEQLGTDSFARLRFGIGRPAADFVGSGADFVLESFPLADRLKLAELIDASIKVIDQVIELGLPAAMNRVNRRNK